MRIRSLFTHPRRRLFAVGGAIGLVTVGFVAGYARRPMPLHEHAAILLQAILEEDGATILSYVHPVERELNNLTPETTAVLVREFVNDKYKAWEWTQESSLVSSSIYPRSGEAQIMGRIPGVGRAPRSIQVWRFHAINDGRPMISLSEIILAMWVREHRWENRRYGRGTTLQTSLDIARAWASGYDRETNRLKELGFRYHTSLNFDEGQLFFRSLEDMRTMKRYWLADPEGTIRNPQSPAMRMRESRYWRMTADQAREHKRQQAQGP